MYSVDDILNGDVDEVDDELETIEDVQHEDDEIQREDDEVKKDEEDEAKPVKKVKRQSQRPLLNVERLKGPRGLICMEKTFSNLKFQGSGHEEEDLNNTMTMLQHWCHRLYPKYTFDETLEQLEKLGTKKPLITLKRKVCMNMLQDEIFGIMEPDPEENLEPVTEDEPPPRQVDVFDLLVGTNRLPLREREPSPEVDELTEEQKEIMAKNRLLAAERRKARIEVQLQKENISSTFTIEAITPETEIPMSE